MALTRWTFVGKVMSLLFNMLSRLAVTLLPRSKRLSMRYSKCHDCGRCVFYLFLAALGLHCCVGTSLVAVSRGYFLLQCMTNLDSIFKSRDITLPTNVHLVKAVVFPVVMYGVRVGL